MLNLQVPTSNPINSFAPGKDPAEKRGQKSGEAQGDRKSGRGEKTYLTVPVKQKVPCISHHSNSNNVQIYKAAKALQEKNQKL